MVRLRCHKPQQLLEIGERVPDDMPSIDESRLAERASQLRTSKRVVEHQLPLARLEANRNLLILLDPLAHHRSFLTLRSAAGGEQCEPRSAAAQSSAPSQSS